MATQAQVHKLTMKAAKYCEESKLSQAKKTIKKLMSADKNNFNAYQMLGLVYINERRYEVASDNLRKAVAIAPQGPEVVKVMLNLALCYEELNDLEQVVYWYDQVLKHDMTNTKALLGISRAHTSLGQLKEALIACKQLVFYPAEAGQAHSNARAIAHWSIMQSPIVVPDITDVDYLKRDIAQASPKDEYAQINYHFALATGLERMERYDEAFAAYEIGNKIKHASTPYPEAKVLRDGQSLINCFEPSVVEKLQTLSKSTEAPIFIVGLPRSGTTLLESILDAVPNVVGRGELPAIPNMITELEENPINEMRYPNVLPFLDEETINRFAQTYLKRAKVGEGERSVDKLPGNFWHVGFIKILFPDAKIIHCFKNPIDACFSLYKQHFHRGHPYCYDLNNIIKYQKFYYRLMEHWRDIFGEQIFQLPYEGFVESPEAYGESLFKFCDLQWDPGVLESFTKRKSVKTASVMQVREGIFKTSLMRWKHYEQHLSEAKKIFKPFYDDNYEYSPKWHTGIKL